MPSMPDFANILFAGPCNRTCPFCIGKLMPDRVNVDNLDVFPLRGLDGFVEEVNGQRIEQIVMTGTVTDPQLYRHEERLLALLRERLHEGARFSVHTNGVLALRKWEAFNAYDRACISFPSFEPATYEKLMGSRRVPDLAAIVARARIPVKVSCVVNDENLRDVDSFLARCRAIGVRRVVLRKLYGETRELEVLRGVPVRAWFRGNPVVDVDGMEVTWWDFDRTAMSSLNLFADGTLGTSYLIARTPELAGGHS
jgi:MoaA/NifB/PqqE/SkfB family radical SAM enzyme